MTLDLDLRRALLASALVLLLQQATATLYAIQRRLPYEVGGVGEPQMVARDSLSRGTALSAPVTVLVLFAVLVLLSSNKGPLGRVGAAGLAVLGLVFLVAGVMEPVLRRTLASGHPGFQEITIVCLSVSGFLLAAIVIALGFMNTVAPRRDV